MTAVAPTARLAHASLQRYSSRMPPLLREYVECLRKTGKAVFRSPWTLLLPMGYGASLGLAAVLVSPLGIIGSFILGFFQAALMSSLLYFLDELVGGTPVKPRELLLSLRRYLWPVINVQFIFFIAQLILRPVIAGLDNGPTLYLVLLAALFVLLNATPECIYQKRLYGGIATLGASISFIQTHWLEWFIPNVLVAVALWFVVPLLALLPLPFYTMLGGFGASFVIGLIGGALLLPVMVFRGFLFQLLDTTTARQRAYRYNNRKA